MSSPVEVGSCPDSCSCASDEQHTYPKKEIECAICFMKFEIDEANKKTKCGHYFHCNCLSGWVHACVGKATCPMCRKHI
jgi:hypothetical protein